MTPDDKPTGLILCDLNVTLSSNMKQVMAPVGDFASRIRRIERYRMDLVEWLTEAQAAGWQVDLFTVRRAEQRQVTLETILNRTGWAPDGGWFNDTDLSGSKAAAVKRHLLSRAVIAREPALLYALESNPTSRAMLSRFGVPARRFDGKASIPTVAELPTYARPPDPVLFEPSPTQPGG